MSAGTPCDVSGIPMSGIPLSAVKEKHAFHRHFSNKIAERDCYYFSIPFSVHASMLRKSGNTKQSTATVLRNNWIVSQVLNI